MKHKTAELKDDTLDYMVQCAERGEKPLVSVAVWGAENDTGFQPSRHWAQGGPIIERERISVYEDPYWLKTGTPPFLAGYYLKAEDGEMFGEETGSNPAYLKTDYTMSGSTYLIAAMRAYIASEFGDEVELP